MPWRPAFISQARIDFFTTERVIVTERPRLYSETRVRRFRSHSCINSRGEIARNRLTSLGVLVNLRALDILSMNFGGTATRHHGVCREKDFPHQGSRKAPGAPVEFRAGLAKRGHCGLQHRSRLVDFSSSLQIDFPQRRLEASEARTGGLHGHQREPDP